MRLAGAVIVPLLVTGAAAAEEPVRLSTPTGALHGTLDLPEGSPPYPAVLVISGSGPTDRDGNQPRLRNDSLKQLGRGLAQKGIAALRYDKRAIGESARAGPREEDLRFETFVSDAVDWVALLRRDARISRVGIIGHSEGALIGILAAKQAQVAALVSIAGAGHAAPELIRPQLQNAPPILRTRSNRILDELVAGKAVGNVPDELAALYRPRVQPYLISWFRHDPVKEIATLSIPLLVIQGTTDLQVSVEDAGRLATAKKNAKLRLITNMNHVLKRATTAEEQQAAYTDPAIPIHHDAVAEIARFLREHLSKGDGRES